MLPWYYVSFSTVRLFLLESLVYSLTLNDPQKCKVARGASENVLPIFLFLQFSFQVG